LADHKHHQLENLQPDIKQCYAGGCDSKLPGGAIMLRAILSIALLFQGIPFPGPGRAPAGGGGGGFTLITNTASQSGTTSSVDTTGANLIVIYFAADSPTTLSDSKSNSWTLLTLHNTMNGDDSRIAYCLNPTVGSGHTFSNTGSNRFLAVQAWSGATTGYVSDTGNGGFGTTASIKPGSRTPGAAGNLIVSGVVYFANAAQTVSVDSGLTISDQANASNWAGGMGYLITPSTSAVDLTWTFSASLSLNSGSSVALFQ